MDRVRDTKKPPGLIILIMNTSLNSGRVFWCSLHYIYMRSAEAPGRGPERCLFWPAAHGAGVPYCPPRKTDELLRLVVGGGSSTSCSGLPHPGPLRSWLLG